MATPQVWLRLNVKPSLLSPLWNHKSHANFHVCICHPKILTGKNFKPNGPASFASNCTPMTKVTPTNVHQPWSKHNFILTIKYHIYWLSIPWNHTPRLKTDLKIGLQSWSWEPLWWENYVRISTPINPFSQSFSAKNINVRSCCMRVNVPPHIYHGYILI